MEYLSTDSAPLSAARQSVWEGIAGLVSTAITAAENAIEQTRASQEARRVRSILENAPVAVMQCNLDLHIEYMNQASFQLLKKIEPELPCRVEEVVGRCIDIFHRHPEKHREMLSDPRNLPHRALIRLGDEHLSLVISALHDEAGTYVGPMLTWELITARMNAEQQKRREAEELAVKVDSLLVHVQAAARGDLTRQIQFEGDNPIDRLGEGLHQLLADFRNSLGEIKHNVLTLSGAAEELTATSKQMQINAVDSSGQVTAASAAGEQVNQNIHMVASASEEMTASIREIAKNAHQAARVSGSAVDVANSTNQTISKLSDSSSEIGKVIKVISSIAQQTNLLALNATIEAARAGESGRGFAVVANEVKELAKETAKATGDITLKIEAIQADSNCAVQAIAKITQIIQEISDIASTIAGAVEEQSVTTCEISRSVSEAAKGSTEISRVIGGVAISSQNSRIGADETLQAAQSLAVLASQLQKLLGHFRL
ncbi:hypothetical protein IV102_34830 [bacterium]|nr:hypothetical protein [bacterium]